MPKLLGWISMTGVRSLVTSFCVCEFMMALPFHLCTEKKKERTDGYGLDASYYYLKLFFPYYFN
jgi:hypothetical protein